VISIHSGDVVSVYGISSTWFTLAKGAYVVDPDEQRLIAGPRSYDEAGGKLSDPKHPSRLDALVFLNEVSAAW
jgi:hypothetical protein